MASLSIDLGAASAPVPRVAPSASAKGEFSRIIGGITSPEPATAEAPKKFEAALLKPRGRRPKGALRPPLPRQAPVQPAQTLPAGRQNLAAVDGRKVDSKDETKPIPDPLQSPIADVAPLPVAIIVDLRMPGAPEIVEQPIEAAPIAEQGELDEVAQIVAIMTSGVFPAPAVVAPKPPEVASLPVPPTVSPSPTTPTGLEQRAPSGTPAEPVLADAAVGQPIDFAGVAGEGTTDGDPLPTHQRTPASPNIGITVEQAAAAGTSFVEPTEAEPDIQARTRPTLLSTLAQPAIQPQQTVDPAAIMAAAVATGRPIRDEWRPAAILAEPVSGVTGPTGIATGPSSAAPPTAASAPAPAVAVPLDTARAEWIESMIDRIDDLRGQAGVRSTQIRLLPDALGQVDVSIRQEGDQVHVNFTVDTAAARTLIADATPRLAELADARGLKLGGAGVETGAGGERRANHSAGQGNSTMVQIEGEEEPVSAAPRDRIA